MGDRAVWMPHGNCRRHRWVSCARLGNWPARWRLCCWSWRRVDGRLHRCCCWGVLYGAQECKTYVNQGDYCNFAALADVHEEDASTCLTGAANQGVDLDCELPSGVNLKALADFSELE